MRGLPDTLADPDAAFETSLSRARGGRRQEKVSRAIFDESLKLWQAEPELGLSDPAAWARPRRS